MCGYKSAASIIIITKSKNTNALSLHITMKGKVYISNPCVLIPDFPLVHNPKR